MTLAEIASRASEFLTTTGLAEKEAKVVVQLGLRQQATVVNVRVTAYTCAASAATAGKAPAASTEPQPPGAVPKEAVPQAGAALPAPPAPQPTNEMGGAQPAASRVPAPPKGEAVATPLGPQITRVLGEAQQVELFQVATPQSSKPGHLASYNVISHGISLTAEEVEQLRKLLLQDPPAYLPGNLVRTCPAMPELMLSARSDQVSGSFETVQIVLSRTCMAILFKLNEDNGKAGDILYYDPIQPKLDDLLAGILKRSGSPTASP